MQQFNGSHGLAMVALMALGSISIAGVAVAERPEPPPYYAIENVRVVVGNGEVIERATVLIEDGLITAVGANVRVPADAWVIDGEGKSVYPGLIDAMTDLGQAKAEAEGPQAGGRGGDRGRGGAPAGPTIRGPEDRPGTTPWVHAADAVKADDARLETWREAGFTAALTAPTKGFFSGQAALIATGGVEAQEMVLAPTVAHRVSFEGERGFRNFPGSLMGILSYVDQTFSDARHDGEVQALYAASPSGRERPLYDRTLAPLTAAIEDGTPFLMPADRGHEIDRVLAFAKEYGLSPIVYGGHGAYARVDELTASQTPVLISLDWPQADKDRDPMADTSFADLHHRWMAKRSPSLLHEAGIPFAFYSAGLSSPGKALENLRQAIDAGLPADVALEAMTLGAARILGVEDRLGSIEAGKIANLVIASDSPFAEDVEIEALIVDGYLYSLRNDDEDKEPPAADVSGTWTLSLQTPGGAVEMTLEAKMAEDGKVTGELTSRRGTSPIEKGRMSGDRLSFKTTRTMGPRTVEVAHSYLVAGEEVSGSSSAGPMSMEVTGSRTARAEDKEEMAEGPAVTREELDEVMAVYQGPAQELGSFAITNARVYTVTGDTLENGTVIVKDGKISAVGSDLSVPADLVSFDAEGGSLIPGIIDAHSHIAIDGAGNEGSLAVTSMVTIQDVVHPDDIAIYRALAGGVTTVNVLHGSANPIGGGNAVLKLRWGQGAEGMRFAGAPPGIKFALGENPKRSRTPPGFPKRYPATRMGVMDVIRQAFTDAREYQRAWQLYDSDKKAGRKPNPPRRDRKLEPLVEILEGKRLVHSHCYRADEILQLLRLAEEFGFKIATLQHVLEGYKVADEIAAHGAGASTFSDWWGYKVEAYDAIPHNAALMTERGVLVSINSDSGEEMRHLNQEAAKMIKWGGMSELEALKLVTLNPALQLGIADRVGSIEVGKDADLVLYNGHPLSVLSTVQKTFVDGHVYFDIEFDRQRQAKVDAIKAKLMPAKDDDEADTDDGSEDSARPSRETQIHAPYSCREAH